MDALPIPCAHCGREVRPDSDRPVLHGLDSTSGRAVRTVRVLCDCCDAVVMERLRREFPEIFGTDGEG